MLIIHYEIGFSVGANFVSADLLLSGIHANLRPSL